MIMKCITWILPPGWRKRVIFACDFCTGVRMKGPSQCGNSNGGAERRCGHTDSLGGAGRSGEASERGPMAWREGGEWVRRCEGATSTGSFTSRGVRLCASLRWRRVGRRWWWCTGVWSGGNGKVNGPLVWKMWTRKLPEQQWTDSFARREKQRVYEAIEFAVSLSLSRFSLWFVRGNNERHSSRCERKNVFALNNTNITFEK